MTTILYGIENKYIDITELASRVCERRHNGMLIIPASDNERSALFGDPTYGFVKHIKVNEEIFDTTRECHILLPTPNHYVGNPHKKLQQLHEKLRFNGDRISDEYPEQVMAMSFIEPHDVVLEIGSNIGRNSLIISSILSNSANLTTLETVPENAKLLDQNRRANFFDFKIINAALSKRKLWQSAWLTMTEQELPADKTGIFEVATIDNLDFSKFTVLVADCEGALYYILQDFPEMLSNIRLIIVENDYRDIKQKQFVEKMFLDNGFKLRYSTNSHEAKMYSLPCHLEFFQAWSVHI